jgi:hypothetical protein
VRDTLFWLAVLSCAVGQALIIRSTVRERAHAERAGADADVPRPRRATELAWTLLPALMLALTLGFTWRAMHAAKPAPMEMPMARGSAPATS